MGYVPFSLDVNTGWMNKNIRHCEFPNITSDHAAYSSDNRAFVFTDYERAYLIDTETTAVKQSFVHDGCVTCDISPDNTMIVTGGQKKLKIWDTNTGALLYTSDDFADYVTDCAFSTDCKEIIFILDDGSMKALALSKLIGMDYRLKSDVDLQPK